LEIEKNENGKERIGKKGKIKVNRERFESRSYGNGGILLRN